MNDHLAGAMLGSDLELGTFMALETLAFGVQGKAGMWTALKQVADEHALIGSMNLDEFIDRARTQYDALERERLAAGRRALPSPSPHDRVTTPRGH